MDNKVIIPAVVLSAHTSGLAVIRALGLKNIPIIVVSYEEFDMGRVSKYVKEVFETGNPADDEAGILSVLRRIHDKYSKAVLIPCDDATLLFLSKHKEFLSKWFIVSATDLEVTSRFVDKKYTYELCHKIGVPAPVNIVIENLKDAKYYSDKVTYPCLVKPSQGHRYYEFFGRKMRTANNKNEILKYFNEAHELGLQVMFQELIPGESSGINYNSIFINNEPVAEFISEKLRYSPDNFGVPCAAKTIELIPEVLESGRKILKAMNFEGFSCTEFKLDLRDNKYKLMEVNGRHNRSALLAVKAGLNFPYLLYQYEVFGILPESSDYKKNVYWIDESRDAASTLIKTLKLKYPAGAFLKPYLSEHVFAVSDKSDMQPILKRIGDLVKISLGRKKNKVEVKIKGAY